MDVIKWLETLLGDCRLVGSVEDLVALLPSIAVDGPHWMDVAPDGGLAWRGCPVGFAPVLRQPLGMMVAQAMGEVVAGEVPADPAELSPDDLAQDPATAILARLLVEAAAAGSRSTSLVMLEAVRQSSQVVWGDLDELKAYSPAAASRARKSLKDLSKRLPARIEYLQGMAWALSARLGGAWSLASALDARVRPTRLYQALVANRLALVAPSGVFKPGTDLDLVAGVLGIEVQEGILTVAHQAISAVLRVAMEGKGGAAGAGLRALAGDRSDIEGLALDPRIAPLALQVLPELLDARALKAAGVTKGAQDRLLKREGTAATGALYAKVAVALGTWDVLAALAGRCLPVEGEGETWTSRLGPVAGPMPWPLLTPRGDGGQVDLVLVGVEQAGFLEAIRRMVEDEEEPLILGAVRGIWSGLQTQAEELGGMAAELGPNVLGFFGSESQAEAWAGAVRSAFGIPLRLELGPLGRALTLAASPEVVTRVASGPSLAGWDGESLWAAGGAVAEALPHGGSGGFEGMAEHLPGPAGMEGVDPFGDEEASPQETVPEASDPFDSEPSIQAGDGSDPFGETTSLSESEEDAFALPPAPDETPEEPVEHGSPAEGENTYGFDVEEEESQVTAVSTEPEEEVTPLAAYASPEPEEQEQEGTGEEPEAMDWDADFESEAEEKEQEGTGEEPEAMDWDADFEPEAVDDFGEIRAEKTFELEAIKLEKPREAVKEDAGLPPTMAEQADSGVLLGGAAAEDGQIQAEGTFEFEAINPESPEEVKEEEAAPSPPMAEEEAPESSEAEAADESPSTDEPEAEQAASSKSAAAMGLGPADLRYLFEGYVEYLDGTAMVFGRRYGARILDMHSYEFEGDKDEVYHRFLLDKIEEGFVPRTDLCCNLKPGIEPEDIDLERIGVVAGRG